MRRSLIAIPLALVFALATTACGGKAAPNTTEPPGTGVIGGPSETPSATAGTETTPPDPGPTTAAPPPQAQWPSPLDCISYDPNGLTSVYEAGVWSIKQGSNEIVRVYGGPSDDMGDKALALAKRYRQVCFIGRGNFRDEKEAYIFEYWRNPSGNNSPI